MNNKERKGFFLHKDTGEVFFSLKVLPIENESEAEFAIVAGTAKKETGAV